MKIIELTLAILGVQSIKIAKKGECEPCDDEPDHCECWGTTHHVIHHSYPVPVYPIHHTTSVTTVIPGYTWSTVLPGNSVSADDHHEKLEAKKSAIEDAHEEASDHLKKSAEKHEKDAKDKEDTAQLTSAIDKINQAVKKNSEEADDRAKTEKVKDEVKKVEEKLEKEKEKAEKKDKEEFDKKME